VTETTRSEAVKTQRLLLSKVPEVTVWFWVIKILCTTVGESFADWVSGAQPSTCASRYKYKCPRLSRVQCGSDHARTRQ
jgi:hypothetical protein